MNKKFTILVSVSTILLVVILVTLSLIRTKPQSEPTASPFAAPTTSPITRNFANGSKSNQSISTIPADPQQDALFTIQNLLPYDSDNLSIAYSPLTNKIYVEKKNEKADEDLKNFLEKNNLTESFTKFPNLFVVATGNIREKIQKENDKLFETYNDQFVPDEEEMAQSSPTPTPNPNDPSSAFKPMTNSFKSLMGFNINLLPYSPTTRVAPTTTTSTSNQGTTSVGNFQNGFPVTPADTTKIPCPISPTVSEIGIKRIFANGVGFYNIRVCKVHGYTINSVKAKDFDNMYTAMKLAGYTFKGGPGNFRTYETQAAGYAKNPSAWAPPGGSQHERGLAVDTSCSNKDGGQEYTPWMNGKARGLPAFARAISEHPCLNWIHNNSSRYGLLLQCDGKGRGGGEISKDRGGCETWHLSPTGG